MCGCMCKNMSNFCFFMKCKQLKIYKWGKNKSLLLIL